MTTTNKRTTSALRRREFLGLAGTALASLSLPGCLARARATAAGPRELDAAEFHASRRFAATYLGDKAPAPESSDMVEGLANWLTDPKNHFFARATINRLWSYYFGRGIIQPVDDMRKPVHRPGGR